MTGRKSRPEAQTRRRQRLRKSLLRQWNKLTISSDFIFGKVMQDKDLYLELLKRIMPELKISDINFTTAQKVMDVAIDAHGIRMDIIAKDKKSHYYDTEMQIGKKKQLRKRSRYYQSVLDITLLDKGIPYTDLNDTYIIFICTNFDPFNKGLCRYTVRPVCDEAPDVDTDDGSCRVFINTKGDVDNVNDGLKNFCDYVNGSICDDPFIQKLDEAVFKAKQNKEWRSEYMKYNMRDIMKKEEGREEGVKQGVKQGMKQGRRKERSSIIKTMLENGKSPQEISDFCSFPLKQVLDVKNQLSI